MSFARKLSARVANLSAFNLTLEESATVLRDTKNQWGRLLLFIDGSRALIPAGTANVEIRSDRIDIVERYRRNQFHALRGLDDYLSTALQDLQHSENDDAFTEEREALDTGTIYTLDHETFAKLRDDYAAFISAAGEDYTDWCDVYGAASFGSDFHMTRVGHGVGYWDRNAGPLGERLTKLCDKFRSDGLYLGDDGKAYA